MMCLCVCVCVRVCVPVKLYWYMCDFSQTLSVIMFVTLCRPMFLFWGVLGESFCGLSCPIVFLFSAWGGIWHCEHALSCVEIVMRRISIFIHSSMKGTPCSRVWMLRFWFWWWFCSQLQAQLLRHKHQCCLQLQLRPPQPWQTWTLWGSRCWRRIAPRTLCLPLLGRYASGGSSLCLQICYLVFSFSQNGTKDFVHSLVG